MYPSDYGFAVGGSSRSSCLSKNLSAYNDITCKGNDWLYLGSTEWTLSPISDNSIRVLSVYLDGYLSRGGAYNTSVVRPVVYLNSNIKRTGGSGTSIDPFIIG